MANTNATPKHLADAVLHRLSTIKTSYNKPPVEVLSQLFETLFYTSLKTEEAQHLKVTVTLIDPNNPDPFPPPNIRPDRWKAVAFENRIDFNVKNLVKLSKAADTWSSSLAIFYTEKNELFIWGMIDQAIHYQSYLNHEAEAGPEQPGLFQSTIIGIGNITVLMDYQMIASLRHNILTRNFIDVLNRGQVSEKIDTISKSFLNEAKKFIIQNHPAELESGWERIIEAVITNSIARILLRIQNYQHGGAILITESQKPHIDIKYKMQYSRLKTAISNLSKLTIANYSYENEIFLNYTNTEEEDIPVQLYLNETVSGNDKDDTRNELKGAIRFIGSLCCVDGLVLMDQQLNVNGFGAVITVTDLPESIYVSATSEINPDKLTAVSPNSFGTRHRSMFSYCWHNPGSLGFVISQDGDVRAIMRVNDQVILWDNIRVHKFSESPKLKKSKTRRKIKSKQKA